MAPDKARETLPTPDVSVCLRGSTGHSVEPTSGNLTAHGPKSLLSQEQVFRPIKRQNSVKVFQCKVVKTLEGSTDGTSQYLFHRDWGLTHIICCRHSYNIWKHKQGLRGSIVANF